MNETFSFKRFGLLFKKTILEQLLQIFGVFGVAMLATLIFYPPFDIKHINLGIQSDIFDMVLTVGTGCMAFLMFNHFSENAKGYNYLLLPSSYFEKWMVGFLMTAIFLIFYLIFFRIVDTHHVNALHKTVDLPTYLLDEYLQNTKKRIQILQFDSFYPHRYIYMTFIGTGIIALGNLYIKKNAFVKICLILVGLIWTFIYLDRYIFKLFFDNIGFKSISTDSVSLREGGTVAMPQVFAKGFDILYQLVFPSILWLIALIRLREKEI